MAHTPGPWTTGSHGYGNVKGHGSPSKKFRRVRHGDVEVARVWCGEADDNPSDSQPDDLMLILAAPELLEACKYMRDNLVDWIDTSNRNTDSLQGVPVEDFINWVIAKAEGRA